MADNYIRRHRTPLTVEQCSIMRDENLSLVQSYKEFVLLCCTECQRHDIFLIEDDNNWMCRNCKPVISHTHARPRSRFPRARLPQNLQRTH